MSWWLSVCRLNLTQSQLHLKISPTFDKEALTAAGNPSNAWANAKIEAIDAIENSNLPADIKEKAVQNARLGNFTTHTVGDGAIKGQKVVQVYQEGNKVD